MTKFIDNTKKEKKKGKKTVFKCWVDMFSEKIKNDPTSPYVWKNVEFIGYDSEYGDVFKAWDDNKHCFTIYFGKKGDEFD